MTSYATGVMSKSKTFPRLGAIGKKRIASRAMIYFWREGFYAPSISEIIEETGVDQHSLYTEFNGRQGLFLAALQNYIDDIATAGFAPLETGEACAEDIAEYFKAQAEKAIEMGLPGQGCFITNTILKTSPQNRLVRRVTDGCLLRMRNGFESALVNEAGRRNLKDAPIAYLASFLTTSSMGLWIYAGHTGDAEGVWSFRQAILDIVQDQLPNTQWRRS